MTLEGMSFNNSQQSYYVREINRAVPTAPQMAVSPLALDSALGEPDSGRVHLDSILTEAGGGSGVAAAQRRDAACRALPYPGPGMRDPAARTGCGWWFVPEPSRQSVGAYGTRRGPMSPTLDTSIGPGQWIWDPREAQRLEGMKHAANVRACPDIQLATFPNIGWCKTTGMATLADSAGNPMFPNMPGGDCPGEALIMNAAGCPPPPPPPSAGGAGGSGPTTAVDPGVMSICTPDSNGALSPRCLQALAWWGGCAAEREGKYASTLAVALENGYAGNDQNFNNVNAVLSARGFQIHPGIVKDGKLSVQDAINSYRALWRMSDTSGDRANKAAANLCYGAPFSPCDMSPSQRGPWNDYADCIINAATQKGYSPQGRLLPGYMDMANWNALNTWGDVLKALDTWMAMAHDQSNPEQQKLAIEYVYGLNLNFPASSCPIPDAPTGIYVLGPYGIGPWGTGWTPGFPGDPMAQWIWVTPNAQGGAPTGVAFMTKSYVNNTGAPINVVFHIAADDSASLVVNGILLTQNAFQYSQTSAVLQPGSNNIVLQVANTGGPAGVAVICRDSASGNNIFVSDSSWQNLGYAK